ncbi:MAG: dTMP kinase [Thermodesulfobacteriota bacterium]
MGLFITFEGIEGCGKSTQVELLRGYLEARGLDVVALREPGGTVLGERIREMLVNHGTEEIDPAGELLLYEAARAQLTARVIAPALAGGRTVVCDRFIDSTVAYQGHGRGLPLEDVCDANRVAARGTTPDVTFLIDFDPAEGLARAWKRIEAAEAAEGPREDRFESEDLAFHARVRRGYLMLAEAEPERIRVVDGRGSPAEVHRRITEIIEGILT